MNETDSLKRYESFDKRRLSRRLKRNDQIAESRSGRTTGDHKSHRQNSKDLEGRIVHIKKDIFDREAKSKQRDQDREKFYENERKKFRESGYKTRKIKEEKNTEQIKTSADKRDINTNYIEEDKFAKEKKKSGKHLEKSKGTKSREKEIKKEKVKKTKERKKSRKKERSKDEDLNKEEYKKDRDLVSEGNADAERHVDDIDIASVILNKEGTTSKIPSHPTMHRSRGPRRSYKPSIENLKMLSAQRKEYSKTLPRTLSLGHSLSGESDEELKEDTDISDETSKKRQTLMDRKQVSMISLQELRGNRIFKEGKKK